MKNSIANKKPKDIHYKNIIRERTYYHISFIYRNNQVEISGGFYEYARTDDFEDIFNLQDLKNINRNFRIYDTLDELLEDVNSYIEQKKIYITTAYNPHVFECTIYAISPLDNKILITLNERNIRDDKKEKIPQDFYEISDKCNFKEELKRKKKEKAYLKKIIDENEKKNKEDMNKAETEISQLDKRISLLEGALETLIKKDLSFKTILGVDKDFDEYNLENLKKESKIIKTKKPINAICVFPRSRNYIESSGPQIFDKDHNLLLNLENPIGFCDCMCIGSENLVILAQKNILILLNIINAKKKLYKYYTFKDMIKKGNIKKIIRGKNELEFLASDDEGKINILEIEFKENRLDFKLKFRVFSSYNCSYYNIFLLKDDLIILSNNIYKYYYLSDSKEDKEINDLYYYKFYEEGDYRDYSWNEIIFVDEKNNLIGVAKKSTLYILNYEEQDKDKILKEKIEIQNETIDCIYLYQHKFIIIGSNQGNLHFYNINYKHIKTIKNAHQKDKDSIKAINGIIEISDGEIATYGCDKKIKIWYV